MMKAYCITCGFDILHLQTHLLSKIHRDNAIKYNQKLNEKMKK